MINFDNNENNQIKLLNVLLTTYSINQNVENEIVIFDIYCKNITKQNRNIIFNYLDQIIEYLLFLQFNKIDIKFSNLLNKFNQDYLTRLSNFRFYAEIYANSEWCGLRKNEPIITFFIPLTQAQFIESILLEKINHDDLIEFNTRTIVHCVMKQKKVWRIYNQEKYAIADILTTDIEDLSMAKDIVYINPQKSGEKKVYKNCLAVELQKINVENGKKVFPVSSIIKIREYIGRKINTNFEIEEYFVDEYNYSLVMSPLYYDIYKDY